LIECFKVIFFDKMEIRIANIISYIFHPLFIPMLGLLIISNSSTYAADLDHRFTSFIYFSVFVLTLLFPLVLIPFFYYGKLTSKIQLADQRERLMPFLITFVLYFIAYLLIRKLPISHVYQRFLFAACLSVLLVILISYFWKISAHMVGWGGLVGLILSLSIRFETDLMLFLIIAILISGLVGFARLKLEVHNQLQVFSGFLVGLFTILAVFFI
jgi:membrane-associated phospholipid phosphatase